MFITLKKKKCKAIIITFSITREILKLTKLHLKTGYFKLKSKGF